MSSLNKGRANEPLLNKSLQLHQESVFDTESKYSISSFASTRLPTLSSFSGNELNFFYRDFGFKKQMIF